MVRDNVRVAVPGRACGEAPATRTQARAAYSPTDVDGPARITEVCHMLNPHAFGVRARRHFIREGHRTMPEQILSGQVGIDLPPL